jgi:hypothetical protein
MERTGIEPVTSGLQILSGAGQAWSARVDVRWLRDWSWRMRRDVSTMVSLI